MHFNYFTWSARVKLIYNIWRMNRENLKNVFKMFITSKMRVHYTRNLHTPHDCALTTGSTEFIPVHVVEFRDLNICQNYLDVEAICVIMAEGSSGKLLPRVVADLRILCNLLLSKCSQCASFTWVLFRNSERWYFLHPPLPHFAEELDTDRHHMQVKNNSFCFLLFTFTDWIICQ
jgi:hypothetical protein